MPLLITIIAAILLQFALRPIIGDFQSNLLLKVGTNVILAVSLTMVNGFTGQFSMGHAAFMLIGGYVTAMLVYYTSILAWGNADLHGGIISSMAGRDGVPWVTWADGIFFLALIAGGLVSAVCGYLVGLPSLRLRGDYLAIVTLGFGEIVRVIIQSQTKDVLAVGASIGDDLVSDVPSLQAAYDAGDPLTAAQISQVPVYLWPKYVGGSLGFVGLPFYSNLFWIWLFVGITVLVAYRLKQSSSGRAFLSIREDEIAAEAMGVNTTAYKVWAFVIAAFFAGIAGGLFAHTSGVQLNPGELGFQKSFDIIIMAVLGGLGSITGSALAAAVLTYLSQWLIDPGHIWPVGIGVAVLAGVLAKRRLRAVTVVVIVFGALELARWGALSMHTDLSKYRMVLYALALILMMILRPQGLLGGRELWEPGLWRALFANVRGRGARK